MIEVMNLTKKYGTHTAVDGLSFTVESGHIYGFLGPNGAGKSTTMNIITGCLSATEGQVLINGHDIFEESESAKKMIGYLPEHPPLYSDMTPYEYLRFVAKAKGVKKSELDAQITHVMEVTQISDVSDRLIRHLSKGYKQRVGIAQALLGNPEIIILDEPTVGLDPLQITEIRELIKTLGENHTVIFSSHILSEVRAICDRIMIISKGKLVASDTPENLESLFSGNLSVNLTVKAAEDEVHEALKNVSGVTAIHYSASDIPDAAQVVIETDSPEDISENIFFAFCDIRRPILRMSTAQINFEDIFLELTAESESEPAESAEENGILELSAENGYETLIEEVAENESDI